MVRPSFNLPKWRTNKMTNTYSWPGQSWTIGFDSMFDRLEKLNQQTQSYPPHNVLKHGEDKFEIAIAVAGFSEENLLVEQEKNVLTIASKDVDENDSAEYIHRGIATRKFKKTFTLGEYVEVESVALVNGILSVYLDKVVPEEEKPKRFSIGASKKEFLSE